MTLRPELSVQVCVCWLPGRLEAVPPKGISGLLCWGCLAVAGQPRLGSKGWAKAFAALMLPLFLSPRAGAAGSCATTAPSEPHGKAGPSCTPGGSRTTTRGSPPPRAPATSPSPSWIPNWPSPRPWTFCLCRQPLPSSPRGLGSRPSRHSFGAPDFCCSHTAIGETEPGQRSDRAAWGLLWCSGASPRGHGSLSHFG